MIVPGPPLRRFLGIMAFVGVGAFIMGAIGLKLDIAGAVWSVGSAWPLRSLDRMA
jgi:hypothetical protein